ncbi:hypothetical protein F0562_016105 [Nyssa sinensis]|uniref:Mitochondrial import inner membrane translocase subunit TIM50 n=1 Tax=Nyssa sinensis TaxID=561372 RepID=A0A5J4ZNI7_9ASTE|nr:hypothetical protein F0562_016105 [Nyssa sinensis]
MQYFVAFMAAGKLPKLKFKNVVSDNSSDDEEEDTGIDLGLSLEKLNLGPRKKLLVLGLGGLLVHRVHRYKSTGNQNTRSPDAVCGNFRIFRRPFCEEFLEFCFERFEVGIWSSAKEWNVEAVLNTIMKGLYGRLLFVWSQEESTDSGFKTLENKEKPIFLQELNKLWEKNPSLPWRKGQYSSSNTLFIDDEPFKALLNPPNTAIFPHAYKADNVNDTLLGPKGEMQRFLDGLADADDVTSYVKEHPFGQPAITPSHSDWKFYSKIISQFQKGKDAEEKKRLQ